MDPIRIAAVSYLNTFPFVFGIKTSGELYDVELLLGVPSLCAERLKSGEADIALLPAGALPEIPEYSIITDFCIGAESDVRTVLLLSHKPLPEITRIHLDFDSRTSVALARILAHRHWHIRPEWIPLMPGKASDPGDLESLVAIGDKTFALAGRFPYVYDLAGEWIRYSGLPFVFAVWAANKEIPEGFLQKFNRALEYGVNHVREIPEFFRNQIPRGVDALDYFNNNISYRLTAEKRKGLERYLELLADEATSGRGDEWTRRQGDE